MSVTNIKSVRNTAKRADYLLHGHGHAHDDRSAVMYSDMGTVDAFVRRANDLAVQHGRQVQAFSIVQSFAPSELDVADPLDQQICNGLGVALASEMFPNSDICVVTHTDGKGGCLHNHILVANNDNTTGRGVGQGTRHRDVSRINDAVMRDYGMSVVNEPQQSQGDTYWQDKGQSKSYDADLQTTIKTAIAAANPIDFDGYVRALADVGVSVVAKDVAVTDRSGTERVSRGLTYEREVTDPSTGRTRRRRRKASLLGRGYTRDGVDDLCEANAKAASLATQRERERQATANRIQRLQAGRERSREPLPLPHFPATPSTQSAATNPVTVPVQPSLAEGSSVPRAGTPVKEVAHGSDGGQEVSAYERALADAEDGDEDTIATDDGINLL